LRRLIRGAGFLGLILAWSGAPARGNPAVALNEVLADPARDWDGDQLVSSANDEWVEIVNTGAVPADLTGLRIGDSEQEWAYGFTGTLPVGEKLVVYGSTSKAWQTANGLSAFGLRLSNTGDTVVLWHLTAADTTIRRRPDGGATWELFDALNPYTGGALPAGNGCAPSPGLPNNCATPVEAATWGQIKARLSPEGSRR
jgi:hypothetical protein